MKIRVIRFSSLGDCILLCPFLAHLKGNGAEEVSVVTKPAYAELFAATRGVDHIIAIHPGAGYRGLWQAVRAHGRDDHVVVDAHNTMRSRIVSAGLGGAAIRIDKDYRRRLALILLKRRAALPSMSERYSALGESLGFLPLNNRTGGIQIPASAARRATELAGSDASERVVMAPGSRWRSKRWPAARYAELAHGIVEKYGARIVVIGDEGDREAAAAIADRIGDAAVDVTGTTTVMEAAAVISGSRAFVGNDSGLMHLAEAVGVPVVAVFGPTVEAFGYYPALSRSKVVERNIPCRPCSRNGSRRCPKGTFECLEGLPLPAVRNAFDDLIEDRGPRHYVLD